MVMMGSYVQSTWRQENEYVLRFMARLRRETWGLKHRQNRVSEVFCQSLGSCPISKKPWQSDLLAPIASFRNLACRSNLWKFKLKFTCASSTDLLDESQNMCKLLSGLGTPTANGSRRIRATGVTLHHQPVNRIGKFGDTFAISPRRYVDLSISTTPP